MECTHPRNHAPLFAAQNTGIHTSDGHRPHSAPASQLYHMKSRCLRADGHCAETAATPLCQHLCVRLPRGCVWPPVFDCCGSISGCPSTGGVRRHKVEWREQAVEVGVDSPPAQQATWVPPASPFGLIEEQVYHNPWKLLLACMLLNRTTATQVRHCLFLFHKQSVSICLSICLHSYILGLVVAAVRERLG